MRKATGTRANETKVFAFLLGWRAVCWLTWEWIKQVLYCLPPETPLVWSINMVPLIL